MNKEELEKLINKMYYEYLDTEEAQKIIDYIKKLEQENKILKENAEHNDKVVDKVNWGNQQLKKENQKYKEVIDKVNNKLSQYKNDLKEYQEQDIINHQNISIGLVGVKIRAFEDILKEVE